MKQVLALFFFLLFLSIVFNLVIKLKKNNSLFVNSFFKQNSSLTKLYYNIIFIETNKNREYFTERELCAVESAALNNPHAEIVVYSDKAKISQLLLDIYSNIKLYKFFFKF